MSTPSQPTGEGHPGARPSPQDVPPEPAAKELDQLIFDPHREPSDDLPTVISRAQPRAVSSEEVFTGALRGRRLAHFELIEPIGVGGMAAVLRARDTQLDRPVALKILPPEMAADPESIRRFHQEARAAARLDHENIARVYFCGEDQGLHFIAFEFVEGANLRTVLERRGRLPVGEAVHYLLQIATGLDHAASRGVVHRDIKPSNIIISPNGRAKLVDMGLARAQGPQADQGLTQSGVTLGTFDYISPEQALEPRDADVRSDIYSLGCTFYHVLTGQPPVPEGTAAKKLHHHQHVAPLDPRQLNPDIPDEVAAVLARMMAKDPRDRYPNVGRLVQHLIVVAQKLGVSAEVPEGLLFVDAPLPDPPRARPILLAAVAAALLVGLVLVLGQLGGGPTSPGDLNYRPQPGPDTAGPRPPQADSSSQPRPSLDQPAAKEKGGGPRPGKTADYQKPVPSARDLAQFLEDRREYDQIKVVLNGDLELGGAGRDDDPVSSLVARAGKVTIAADPAASRRPTIRLKYNPLLASQGTLAALVLEGGDVTLQGLRIVVDATASQVNMAGVLFKGAGTYRVINCEFFQADPPAEPAAVERESARLTSVVVDAGSKPGAKLDIRECYFARDPAEKANGPYRGAQDAVKVIGPVEVTAGQCAFAPHQALFRVGQGTHVKTTRLNLQSCSAIAAGDWAAFHLEDKAEAQLHVRTCLFSHLDGDAGADEGPADDDRAVLIRQPGRMVGQLQYVGRENRYHNLSTFWVRQAREGRDEAAINGWEAFKEAVKKSGGDDEDSLVLRQSPWQESDPLRLLKEGKPELAFLVNLKLRELRWGENLKHVVGVERGAFWEKPLDVPLLPDKPPDPLVAGKDLIVDPTVKESGKGVYRSLTQALEEVKARGVIRIRHTGLLPVDPVRLEKASLDVTVAPDQGHRPVLTLGNTTEQEAFLFRVHDGKLTLKDLEFQLVPRRDGYKTQSVVELIGEGSCTFKDCVVTLDRAGKKVPLAVVKLSDPALVMRMDAGPAAAQVPGINFEDCLVRGDGELLRVRASRPFALEAQNCLFALAGSCLYVQGSREEVPAGQSCTARLERVTVYLSEHLVRLQARDKDIRGLVPLQVKASESVFVSRDAGSLIQLEGPGAEEDKLRGLLQWEGRHNVYGNFMYLLDQQLPGGETPPRPYGADRWKEYTGERDAQFVPRIKAIFTDPPVAEAPMPRVAKAGFKVRADLKAENDPAAYGANLEKIPAPSAPAATEPE